MRKFNIKKFIIVLVCIIAGSFALSGIIFYSTGGVSAISVSPSQIAESQNFPAGDVSSIVIETVSTRVNIISVFEAEKEIRAEFYGSSKTNLSNSRPELSADLKNGVLNISITYPKTINIGLINIEKLYLDVYVPGDYSGKISVETVSAETEIKKLNLDELSVKSMSGRFIGEELAAEEITVNLTSGKAMLKDVEGNLDIETVSGGVETFLKSLDGDININTVSGKVSIFIPGDSQFNFNIKTISGGLKNDFSAKIYEADRKSIQGVVGDNSVYNIDVKTTSGSINILKK